MNALKSGILFSELLKMLKNQIAANRGKYLVLTNVTMH